MIIGRVILVPPKSSIIRVGRTWAKSISDVVGVVVAPETAETSEAGEVSDPAWESAAQTIRPNPSEETIKKAKPFDFIAAHLFWEGE